MSGHDVEYPKSQPTYTAAVVVEPAQETLLEDDTPKHPCAKCFMGLVSLIFIVLGIAMAALAIYTVIVLNYTGGVTVLVGWPLGSVYTALIVGLVLLVSSVIVWVSSCNPTAFCSKFVLILFSIIMIAVFLVQVALVALGAVWVGVVNVDGIAHLNITNDVDEGFYQAVNETMTFCCTMPTMNETGYMEFCDVITGTSPVTAACASFSTFYATVLDFLTPLLKWVAAFLGVVAFFNLVALVCSCCLLCTKKSVKRSAYYRPTTAQ